MNTEPLFIMLAVQLSVTVFIIYFFWKVLRKKSNGAETLIDDQLEGYSEQTFYDLNCENLSINPHKFIDFSYYPNPVDNILNLKANFNIESVKLYNLLGQKLFDISPNKRTSEVDLQDLQTGVYLMKVFINGTSETVQVIKT